MIYSNENNRGLIYRTPLTEYIKQKHLYNNENLIFSKKYSGGTFTITNPTNFFKNCDFINGYPHFSIPIDICLEEIYFFLKEERMYDNNIYIRYGDTHPHKCIPKLAQLRNLLVENSISSMIGDNSKTFYGFGDISIKSLKDFINKYDINYYPENLYKDIVNNNVSKEIKEKLEKYNFEALRCIVDFLKEIKLEKKEFLIESSLYKDQELYKQIKNNPDYKEELKDNGEFKYSLQELMVINSILKNDKDILINIIGANQTSHVLKVKELLKEQVNIKNRFLTYQICKNGDDRDLTNWSKSLIDFIEINNLKRNNSFMEYQDLLKILMIINSNDTIVDFDKLNKYKNNIIKFNKTIDSIDGLKDSYNVKKGNDLIYMMALVCYNLNRSIEMGSQNNFYKYIISIVNEFETKKDFYSDLEGLYKLFLNKCFKKIGYNNKEKRKVLVK